MKLTIQVAIFLLLLTPAFVNAQSHGSKDEKTKDEIQKLFSDLNEAIAKKDRTRLELLQAQGTRLAQERNPINLDPKLLDAFVGKYQFGPNALRRSHVKAMLLSGAAETECL